MVSEVSKDTVSASSDGWVSHDPRYGGGYRPCDADLVVEVSDTRKENVRVDRAGDIFWGYGSDCEHPVWFWRPVNPQPHKPQSGASSEAVERLSVDEAVRFLDEAGAMLGRGEMPAPGTPYAARWYMAHAVVISTLRSQADALEFYADERRWREYWSDALDAAFDRNGGSEFGSDEGAKARAALTPEVKS